MIIREEFEALIMAEEMDFEALIRIIPPFKKIKGLSHGNPAHQHDVEKHSIEVWKGVPDDVLFKILAIFHDIGKGYVEKTLNDFGYTRFKDHPEESARIAAEELKRIGYSKGEVKLIETIIRLHDTKLVPIKEYVDKYGENLICILLTLQEVDIGDHSFEYREKKLEGLKEIKKEFRKITGKKL